MKRSLLLSAIIAGVLVVAHPAPAQTVLMSQDFNDAWSTTNPPTGWRIYRDGDTSANDWHRAPDLGVNRWPDNPTPYALLDSAPTEMGEDSLISPLVNCSGYNVIALRCSTYYRSRPQPYQARLLGAVDGGPFDYVILDYNSLTIGPTLQEFDLSWAVGHSQVQVAWFFSGASDRISFWAIDDVSITGDNVTDDVGCVAILAPTDTVDSNVMATPRAIFKNYSPDPVTFPVRMTISSSYVATDTVHDLAPGESTTVDFAPWSAAPRGNLPVEAMTLLHGDIDPSNDTVRGSVVIRVRDVGCIAITVPSDTIDSGFPIQPIARIRNFGTDTATFYAYFTIDSWIDSMQVDRIPPSEEWEVAFASWPANASLWTNARCSTAWSMDPYALNDAAGRRFFVKPPHYKDVAAVRILQPPGFVGENLPVTPTGVIRSYCADPQVATAYFTMYDSGGVAVYTKNLARTIQPGESLLIAFPTWIAGPLGRFTDTLRVSLDGDANPENDVVGSQFEVLSAFHDIGVVAITSPADTVFAGAITPGAYVKNYGTFAETFFAKYRVLRGLTPVYHDSAMVTALNPGESTLVAFPVWTAAPGIYTARCTTGVPGDVDPSSNWQEKGFVVVELPIPPGWTEVASMPLLPSSKDIKDGGWLVYDRGLQLIFGAKGYKQTDFYAYFPLGDTWKTLKAIPSGTEEKPPSKGAYGCTDGNGTLYATKGNNKLGFYKYSFDGDSWRQLKDVPIGGSNKKVKGGTGLRYCLSNGAGYVYLLKGYKNEFYRYHTDGDSWHALQNAPVGSNLKWDKGSWIAYDGAHTIYAHKAKYHEFYAYNTDTDVWFDTLTAMPIPGANGEKKSKDGSCATWYDASILALKGGNTQEFWQYFVAGDTWHQLDTIPRIGTYGRKKKIKAGAGIVSVGGNVFYATKGNKCREFWRYRLAGNVDIREDYVMVALPAGSDGLSIAPNPATGYATVRLASVFAASSSIRVYDIRGSLVMERPAAASSLVLDCRGLTPGVYFVHARSPGAQATCRLVKE